MVFVGGVADVVEGWADEGDGHHRAANHTQPNGSQTHVRDRHQCMLEPNKNKATRLLRRRHPARRLSSTQSSIRVLQPPGDCSIFVS